MNIHFIAIGGAAMHNLAIALKEKGYQVSGSDDEIFEPSRSRLENHGILPEKYGWFPEKVTSNTDAVILGMHARKDNPELKRALSIGVNVYSYPEYLYQQTKNKKRLVIAGSHGKTTITSMVMHALRKQNIRFDYMVGANIEGFDTMVGLSDDANIAVFEGDEYLSSPIDPRPKFLWYKPYAAVITGIAWDHANVFPTCEIYFRQFADFVKSIQKNGSLYYFAEDTQLSDLVDKNSGSIHTEEYKAPRYITDNNKVYIQYQGTNYPVSVFGKHNMENLEAARRLCQEVGVDAHDFFTSLADFKGAARRLQLLAENQDNAVFLDFAHAPSKVMATCSALKEQYPERKLIACLELHTFSSLNQNFLPQYAGSLDSADEAWVYFNPTVVEHKKLPVLDPAFVKKCFKRDVHIFTDSDSMMKTLKKTPFNQANLLIMTSGNFDGQDIHALAAQITSQK